MAGRPFSESVDHYDPAITGSLGPAIDKAVAPARMLAVLRAKHLADCYAETSMFAGVFAATVLQRAYRISSITGLVIPTFDRR